MIAIVFGFLFFRKYAKIIELSNPPDNERNLIHIGYMTPLSVYNFLEISSNIVGIIFEIKINMPNVNRFLQTLNPLLISWEICYFLLRLNLKH